MESDSGDNLTEKILQFGGGNFLRAFADWMIDILNESSDFNGSVVIVKPTSRGDYRLLKKQKGRYHILMRSWKDNNLDSELHLVRCISRVIHPYSEWTVYLSSAQIDSIRFIISNTTESGIRFNDKDGIADRPPQEFPAKLTLWLFHRWKHFDGDTNKGCIMLPCELITNNGSQLKNCILQYVALWGLDPEFKNWIINSNYFCNTLVDRIVSGFPKNLEKNIRNQIGDQDKLLVECESYHSWIIQGPDFIRNELPFHLTGLNVKFEKDLEIFRLIKVRLLNGAHTAMVPIGILGGIELVSEAMNHPLINQFIRELLIDEVIPTIDHNEKDLQAFATSVFQRFMNPSIQHHLIDISLNSISKFKTRLSATLRDYAHLEGQLPGRIIFSLAALIRLYKGEIESRKIPLRDGSDTLAFFTQQWKTFNGDYLRLVQSVLASSPVIVPDINHIPDLEKRTAFFLMQIDKMGVFNALVSAKF